MWHFMMCWKSPLLIRCIRICIFLAVATLLFVLMTNQQEVSVSNKFLNPHENTYSREPWSRIRLAEKKMACIPNDAVTVLSGGRLGNQIMEYASVWSIARLYGLKPFVPDDIIKRLDYLFEGLSVPTINEFLTKKTSCKVEKEHMKIEDVIGNTKNINRRVDCMESILEKARNTSRIILVEKYNKMGETIVPLATQLHEEFHYKPSLLNEAQRSLATLGHKLRNGGNISHTKQVMFVGIHVRRTDYGKHIHRLYNVNEPAGVDYYLRAVHWMRTTLWEETARMPLNIAFVMASDDPEWCQNVLIPALRGVDSDGKVQEPTLSDNMGHFDVFWGGQGDETTPEQDLVLLSSCNHSIYEYGSFGLWSALMAGGRTVVYDIRGIGQKTQIRRKTPSMVFAEHMDKWVILP